MTEGTADKIKGTIKEAAGKLTGDRRTEAEGKTDQVKGDVKNAGHDLKEAAKGVRDSLEEKDKRR
ncbi:CsbD family protein [Benzoatithermus flavus]|uniref:CsbD family protein n=1 Tax=Benzoatithermus flavus TaxID=3108223 RepID=A0ABU8XLK0_9PROT